MLDAWDRRDKWSAISCITVSPVAGRPGLYFDLLDHNVHGEDVVEFLAELHRQVGPVTVVWDRNQIHSRAKAVKAWLAKHPGVVVEDFPGYVPDLNPDEGVWGGRSTAGWPTWRPPTRTSCGTEWSRSWLRSSSGPTCSGGSSVRPGYPDWHSPPDEACTCR